MLKSLEVNIERTRNEILAEIDPNFTPEEDEEDFEDEGYVDYSLGAAPHTGAFVVCHKDIPAKRELMIGSRFFSKTIGNSRVDSTSSSPSR